MLNLSNEQYHSDTSRISKSGLDLIAQSPAHYYAQYLDPDREPRKTTAAFTLGSLFHSLVLEPDKTYIEFAVLNPAIGKKQLEAFIEANAGKTFVDVEAHDTARRMRDAVLRHPAAAYLLSKGLPEKTFYFTDPETGVRCKIRPDFINTEIAWFADLKSTNNASKQEFARSCVSYRYYVQPPYYMDGFTHSTGKRPKGFAFIAVEKTPPYGVAVYHATEADIELGREVYQQNLRTYAECLKTGVWKSYPDEMQALELPAYAFKQI